MLIKEAGNGHLFTQNTKLIWITRWNDSHLLNWKISFCPPCFNLDGGGCAAGAGLTCGVAWIQHATEANVLIRNVCVVFIHKNDNVSLRFSCRNLMESSVNMSLCVGMLENKTQNVATNMSLLLFHSLLFIPFIIRPPSFVELSSKLLIKYFYYFPLCSLHFSLLLFSI